MRALELFRGTHRAFRMFRGIGAGDGDPMPSGSHPMSPSTVTPAPAFAEKRQGGPPKGTARLVGKEGATGPAMDEPRSSHSPHAA